MEEWNRCTNEESQKRVEDAFKVKPKKAEIVPFNRCGNCGFMRIYQNRKIRRKRNADGECHFKISPFEYPTKNINDKACDNYKDVPVRKR